MKNYLTNALQANHFSFPQETVDQLHHYLDLLQHWNRAFNLTAIRDPNEMVILHILDSLSIHSYLQGNLLLDVGTGAGLPGIPLAVINPERQFVLLDSNVKKISFLTQVVHELKIKNVELIHARCEDFHPEKCFQTILSRAFSSIKVMLATTQHLICERGQFLAMKGRYPEEEVRDIPPGFRIVALHPLTINGLNAERHLVCISKEL